MKILILTPDAFGGRGGIAKYNQDLINSLCSYSTVDEVLALPRKIVDSVENLPSKLTYKTQAACGKFKFILVILREILKAKHFDLIICGHINLLPAAYFIHYLNRNSSLFLMLYGIESWQQSPHHLANYLTRYVDGVISISNMTLNKFIQWTKLVNIRNFILPNAVRLDNYFPFPKSLDLISQYNLYDKTVLMTLGRLSALERYKGFDEVIDLLPTLLAEYPNFVYLIVGEGDDRTRLETKVKTLKLEDHVVFTGFISENRKADYYRLCDAFLLPSRGEGFGFVLLEAMACGIPVLASKLDGSREALLNGKLGILVDPRNPEELRLGILKTLQTPRKMSQELDYFSYENFERRCHLILDQIFES